MVQLTIHALHVSQMGKSTRTVFAIALQHSIIIRAVRRVVLLVGLAQQVAVGVQMMATVVPLAYLGITSQLMLCVINPCPALMEVHPNLLSSSTKTSVKTVQLCALTVPQNGTHTPPKSIMEVQIGIFLTLCAQDAGTKSNR